ncbi:ribosome-releasing factor 2, mitochondrial [Grus americana]|uniref:ribosome-releasing factor 2, mitochondrial n=1 Tax=Grus americana TaxID=9117 RepID=UPI0024080786|nr:ribosome-releasing factor 2, mitochondrial [Grus americana]XP_054667093.1 ribosome-releasing factor 2, mitochondrial [Grus americana]XP_054667094.1 ribosome-releasing factor 2, mitochondrial [Grus americana]XP_054667095.1 ribosome-releasing factor 2, mitochondrial [Grus americana]XP_054667096.1 ribosome-releasing factor 2, mitochondrial [Grus americana]XP_054667097.1 ribosome-releasing factor 2, mitochondrial [Grus americana]
MLRMMRKFSVNALKSSSLCNEHLYFRKTKMRITSVTQKNCSLRNYSSPPGDVKSLRSVINPHISRIRNIGIMAHIDAGKTTTTERMLYYSGYIRTLGDVDDGDTVTDFMVQERERGITIQSAAVTFDWKDYRINLIDTPGHVDFTVEVERCLRVLDGAVAVFDASAGVEAQTLTVWRQADKHQIPRICFLNKMDKTRASFTYAVESIKQKLKTKPLLLQLPIGEAKTFRGLVDVVTKEQIIWKPDLDDGKNFEQKLLLEADDPNLFQEVQDARNTLIEQVADLDDEFAELVLGEYSENFDLIPADKLQSAIRRVTLAQKAVPVLCGSALKNKGVQPLLDAITMYLPAPNERSYDFLQWYKDDLCALAFKVLHDKCRGPLVFVRVYSGSLKPQSAVYNINKSCTERMSRLLLPFADQQIEIPSLKPGNIALTVGLKQSATGDTIVSSKASAVAAARRAGRDAGEEKRSTSDVESLLLAGVEIPDPVFFCTIEPPSMAKQEDLDNALSCLQREDPSLKVKLDPDTGQTILCGMGELHIEIIHDRIKREYGIETYLGPLQIAYRETILNAAQATDVLDKTVGDKRHFVTAELEVRPRLGERATTKPVIEYAASVIEMLPKELQGAIENGITNSCIQGPLLGFPVQDIDVTVQSLTVHPDTSHTMISACVSRCLQKALKKAGIQILEPLMNLEITVSEDHLSAALADLAQRRGSIQEIQSRQDNRVVVAAVPLAETMGYSTVLRSLTSGSATFTLQLASYQALNSQEQSALLQRRMGLV